MKSNYNLEPGDLATIERYYSYELGNQCPHPTLQDDFRVNDIVVILKKFYRETYLYSTQTKHPLRYEVLNTSNGKTFVITHDKLEYVDGVSVNGDVYETFNRVTEEE